MDVVFDAATGEILGQLVTPEGSDPRKVYFLSGSGYGSRPAWMVRIEHTG